MTGQNRALAGRAFLGLALLAAAAARAADTPNIVFIFADDMGYGDPRCFNPQSKCPTPNIDRLAAQGMRFTDAHSAGTTCVPSRYGLLTGRYPFRNASMTPNTGALIAPGSLTIASLLRDRGYATAMVGKWHLGFEGGKDFDYSKPFRGGPVDRGFETFFGQHASLDIPPYFYIDNDRCTAAPTEKIAANDTPGWSPIQGAFWRAGPIGPDFKMDNVLPTYVRKAEQYIAGRKKPGQGKPFFLYLALTAPHTPWLPTEQFRSASMGNLYTQWVAQVDASVGRVLAALDRADLADNTLVFFSSDNGPVWYPEDVKKHGHSSTGELRGMKGDVWEGGHRMPLIARWPGRIKPDAVSKQLVCLIDTLATVAELTGGLPKDGAEDSFSFLPELLARKADSPVRTEMLLGGGKNLCIRQGDWKLIPFLGSGGFSRPSRRKPGPGEPAGQLYNLAADPGESRNLHAVRRDLVEKLTARTRELSSAPRSRP